MKPTVPTLVTFLMAFHLEKVFAGASVEVELNLCCKVRLTVGA